MTTTTGSHRPAHRHLTIVLAAIVVGCGGSPSPSSGAPTRAPIASPLAGSGGSIASGPPAAGLPPFTDMPFYRVDVAGQLVEPGPAPVGKPERAWQVDIGATHWAPILVGGLVVVGTTAGQVIALDGRTGERRWAFQAAHPFTTGSFNGSAAAAGGMVFVSDTSTTYALDASTGAQRWSAPTPTRGSRPLVVDGVVYVGTVGGAVGLDEATGTVAWRWTGPQDVATTAGPVVDGVAFLSSRSDGRLYAIDVHDGSERWHLQTIAVAVGSAEVVGDTVYVGTNQAGASEPVGQVYAVDRATGRPRWQFGGPHGGQLVPGPVRDGIVYVSGETDGIYALRPDGSVAWGPVDAPSSVLPMSIVGETLFEQRRDGSIGAYRAADGTLLWETPSTEDDGGGPPLVDGGMVFSVGDTTGVTAFADPALIAALASPAAPPSPSAAPSASGVPDPFTVVRSTSWDGTALAIPLGMDVGPDGNLYILDMKPSVTVIDPKDGRIVRTWGHQGTGPGEFDVSRPDDNPGYGDIAVAPDGQVYVADGSNHRVQAFRPDGTPTLTFGTFGTGEGQFGLPSEIVIGREGSVYILDGGSNQISKWTGKGKFLWRSPTPDADPDLANYLHGIAVRSDGTLLVTCEQCDSFLVLDPVDGHVRQRVSAPSIGGDRSGPTNLDPAGNIYVAVYGSGSELVFDPAGKLLGGLVHEAGAPISNIGNGHVEWGDTFWPSPVFLPDGRAFTFWKDGLVELSVKLPPH
jgi:outer membrane protein assembly factor BamB